MKTLAPAFWLTNISKRNVSLADLNLTIKAFSSVNLLDKRHYSYTQAQIAKSVAEGSIFKKRDKIVVRTLPPETRKKNMVVDRDTFIPTRERSIYSIKQENYEELNVSDEDFAKDNADTAEMDANKQIISKG
jgi:hypothetical protein